MGFKEVITKDDVVIGSVERTSGKRFWRMVGDLEHGYKIVLNLERDGQTIKEIHLFKDTQTITFKHIGDNINHAKLEAPMPDGRKRLILYIE